MAIAVLLCARCGSHLVDVKGWQSPTTAVLRCSNCSQEAPIDGFTVGRVYLDDYEKLAPAVAEAKKDAATNYAGGF